MNREPTVFRVDRLDLNFTPKPWAYAVERRAEIDAYFAGLQRQNPALWNGRVLMMHRYAIKDGVFSGGFLETDYASFSAWQSWGMPEAGVYDCFGAAAVMTADGAFLLGRMGQQTFHAGHIYFPCGTPDPDDIVGAHVDLDVSVTRELKEETGLDIAGFTAEPGWTTVIDGRLIAQIKVLKSNQNAEVLRARILEYLSHEKQPELSDILIVRGPADFDPAMRAFVTAFLAQRFAGE